MENKTKFNIKVKIGIALIIMAFMSSSSDPAEAAIKILMIIGGFILWYIGYKKYKKEKDSLPSKKTI